MKNTIDTKTPFKTFDKTTFTKEQIIHAHVEFC